MRGEQILAAEIADHAMARAAVVPVGFDEADVLVDMAVGAFDLGCAEVHGVHLYEIGTLRHIIQIISREISMIIP